MVRTSTCQHTGETTRQRFGRIAVVSVLIVILLSACASAPRKPPTTAANDVLFRAIALVGTPYHWGGNTPRSGFDCSGLVDYVYRTSADMALPRTSHALSEMDAPRVKHIGELASGDLLFFRTGHHGISHVAIYVGNGRFVHAPNSGGTVRLDNLSNPYWKRHFAFARRLLD
jgi:cell wall-associated NlpC family hydrolase